MTSRTHAARPDMAARTAAFDWRVTPLGPRDRWPIALTTLVDVMFGSSQPMFVVWGPGRTLVYNDAYAEILAAKHPSALGQDFIEVWHEIRDNLRPIVERAYAGDPVHMDDITLIMHRRGYPEEAHFAFSYTPVRGASSAVEGFFCACVETTSRVQAGRRDLADRHRLERMFEQAPGIIAVLEGPDHVFVLANAAYRALVGRRELIGRPVRQALPEAGVQGFLDLLDRVYADGEPFIGEAMPLTILNADGRPEQHYFDFVYQPILDDAGQVSGIFVDGIDVTERRRAEERLHSVFAIQTVGVMYWNEGFGLTDTNDAFLAMTGFTRDEALGKTWQELTPPEFHDVSLKAVAEVETRGETTPYEKQYYRKDGSRWWGLFAARKVGDEVVEFVLDVTERRQTEQALRESEARFQAIVNSIDQMIWSTQPDGYHDFFNDRWYEYTGVPYGSTDGEGWNAIFHPDDQDRAWAVWRQCLETGEPYHIEYRLRHRSGQYRWVIGRAQPVRDDEGRIVRWYGTCTDIHDLKEAEAELRRLNETLEVRVADEVAAHMRTEEALRQSQKMEAIGQLTGGVAHDFNNLLTVIRSSADLLRRHELSEARRQRYIDAIAETADRAAKLTGQLLAFARRQALKPEPFDVRERLRGIGEMLQTVVGSRVRLGIEAGCDHCFVEADPIQFETALVNMVVNARDAMDAEGDLRIAVEPSPEVPRVRGHERAEGDFVAVSVTDTGHGIDPATLEHIFEPFFTTKEVGKGTGLGLSQVYGFAKQSGGEVDVRSRPGGGTTFTLYLPRVDATLAAEVANDGEADEPRLRGHVLVVEDNEQVGSFSTQLLAEVGFETSWASNAAEALKLLEANDGRFAAVFSDVVMPGMSGVDLGHEIRRRWPGLPVVLTSGYSHVLAQDGRHGFELLHKPYSVEDLMRVLRHAIGRRAA